MLADGEQGVIDGATQSILVVEDDPEMRDGILLPGLQDAGFDIVGAGSAIEAYRSMLTRDFALFILDVGLPDEDGFSLARNLRAVSNAGIVLLTGRHRTDADRVRGLDEGADAYLTKPVDVNVLTATVRSLLRRLRHPDAVRSRSRASGWHVDVDGWNLVAPGCTRVRLTQAERLLVDLLATTPNEAVTREAIISHLAQNIHDFDPHRLEMLVHRLRRKVLADTNQRLPLNAVRGVGYVLIMP